jgi:hypothetical protein
VSKIEVFETNSLKKFNKDIKLNNKIIKLSFDNSKSNITYNGEILDAIGLSKFGEIEEQLFSDNFEKYTELAKDIREKDSLNE